MESATRTACRVVARTTMRWRPSRRRTRRCSSSLWLWNATTCLVAATGPASRASGPLASAFAIRSGSSYRRDLSATRSNGSSAANLSSGSFTTHSSLSELLKEFDYDALILDQFGVLHNGKNALEGTIDCVERIALGKKDNTENGDVAHTKQKKLRLIVLSNTSSPAATTLERLQTKLGFDGSHFCGAVTSGEEAARHIRETYGTKKDNGHSRKFVWCTWDPSNENVPDPNAFLDLCGPNVEPTVDVSGADFVVAHGSGAIRGFGGDRGGDVSGEHEIISMGGFLDDGNLQKGTPISDLLERCSRRNLPLVCANPDTVVQYHDGSLKHMPGKIARRYKEILEERRNGRDRENGATTSKDDPLPTPLPSITIYGKPHTEHFEACLRELEEDRRRDDDEKSPLRVAHVGDSLHHDVAGANDSGIPSIFIVGGIHAHELISETTSGDGEGELSSSRTMPSQETLRKFFDREGITPTHVLSVFNY